MLYEVAIIQKPTAKEQEAGIGESLLLKPTAIIANDEKAASAIAGSLATDVDLKRATVLVRPFA